jgi:hypothetical protein
VRSTSLNPSRYTGYTVVSIVRQRPNPGQRSKRGSRLRLRLRRLRRLHLQRLAAGLWCCAAYDCDALDRVILQVGQLSTPAVRAENLAITLDVTPGPDSGSPTLRARASQLRLDAAGITFTDIDIGCTDLLIRQPRFGCNQGNIAAHGGPTGQIAMTAAAKYDTASGATSFSGSGLRVAGATTQFNGTFQSDTWALNASGAGLDLVPARKLARSWIQLPDDDSLSGHLKFELKSSGRLDSTHSLRNVQARLSANTSDLNYSNQPGTTVAQQLTASFFGTATGDTGKLKSDLELQSAGGQALAGTALVDFGRNPLKLQAHVESVDKNVTLTEIGIHQTDLVDARGTAEVALGGPIAISRAHFDVLRLEFAAAYRSFLQLTLATTDFGALNVGGRANGEIDIANDAVTAVSARLQNVSMADATTKLSLANANGEVHWSADTATRVLPSELSWSGSSAYGLIGGPVRAKFTAQGKDFALTDDTRFPIFDGALVVHKLAIRRFGAPDAEFDFDAHLEPISMPMLSKAFGWPILSGQLAGRVPGVTYRDHVLTVRGDLSASVFDGSLVGSRFKLSDPLGPWPRLDADVTARHLDLDLLTHTFSIGSISGRLDADIMGLELFNWSPIAFDARLQSTPGDRSEHRISQKAVTSISSVGGGGGGVTAALQSGVLQFFKDFHYDRIGISCQLRDEVCLMSGLEPAKTGYYLVKGRGLPRIDIIGNAGRVDWAQLTAQIAASMHSQNIIVR